MKKAFLSALAALCLLGASRATAQVSDSDAAADKNTVAVLSLAGYDKLMANAGYVGKLTGNPDLAKSAEGMLKLFTAGQGLAGLDKSQPWGAVITTDGQQFGGLGFLPVSDLKKLLSALAGLIGEPEADENGVYEIIPPQGGPSIFLKEQGGWAFLAQNAEALDDLPDDPLALLAGLNKQYDIALRAYVQNVPKQFRSLAIDQMKQVAGSMEARPGEDEAGFELRKKMAENQIQAIVTAINETDAITLGWAIDPAKQVTLLDIAVTAKPGSKTAQRAARLGKTKTSFAGFRLPEAAFTLNLTGDISEDEIKQAVNMLDTVRSRAMEEVEKDEKLSDEESKQAVRDLINDFIQVFQSTLESGKIDGGAAVVLDPGNLKFVAGGYVANGEDFDAAVKKLVALAESEPEFPEVKFDAETYKGVRFHTMTVPVADADASKVLGDSVEVYLGVGKQSVFAGLGNGSLEVIKQVIDASESGSAKAPPLNVTVALQTIFEFAATVEENPMVSILAAELKKSPGKDHIRLTATPIPNGVRYRLLAEEGVLNALGKAAGAAKGGSSARTQPIVDDEESEDFDSPDDESEEESEESEEFEASGVE